MEQNKAFKYINTGVFIVICVLAVYAVYMLWSGKGVQDNGNTAQQVRTSIEHSRSKQEQISSGLREAEASIDRSSASIERGISGIRQAEDLGAEIATEQSRIARAVENGRAIISAVRQTAEGEGQKAEN